MKDREHELAMAMGEAHQAWGAYCVETSRLLHQRHEREEVLRRDWYMARSKWEAFVRRSTAQMVAKQSNQR